MSIVQKAAVKAGVEIVADSLPPKQRTVKCFQRLIAAMRATEAEVQDDLSEAHRQLNESLQRELQKDAHIRKLEAELLRVRLKEGLSAIEALTVADRTKLLTVTDCNGN